MKVLSTDYFKEYMVIGVVDGRQVAHFFTSAQAASDYHEQLTINGDYSQIYRLFSIDDRSTRTPMWEQYMFVTD